MIDKVHCKRSIVLPTKCPFGTELEVRKEIEIYSLFRVMLYSGTICCDQAKVIIEHVTLGVRC